MKKIILFLFLSFNSAHAVDLIVPTGAGGTMHKFSTIIVDEMSKQGYDINMVLAGNCVQAKQKFDSSDVAMMMNAEATQIVDGCDIPITEKNYATNLFTTDWRLVSKHGNPGERLGVVSMMKDIFKDTPSKIIPYANTSELDAALLAGEVDSIFTVISKSFKEGYQATQYLDIQLNYYLLKKGPVEDVIATIETNQMLGTIGDKKGIAPKRFNTLEQQIEYLNTNEATWR